MQNRKSDIIQNLKDAGCDKSTSEAFILAFQAENSLEISKLLQAHRGCLLDKLHKYQKQIDCLDYLVFMLNRNSSNIDDKTQLRQRRLKF